MTGRRFTCAAGLGLVFALGLWATVAHGDDHFVRKTDEADRTLTFIDRMTSSIEAMRSDAGARGQAMRISCLDVQLKAARDNRAVARGIRARWGAGEESLEYLNRSTERLMRLQVYAMVFEDEARGCVGADRVVKSLEVTRTGNRGDRGLNTGPNRGTNSGSGAGDDAFAPISPDSPRLERPPLASPF